MAITQLNSQVKIGKILKFAEDDREPKSKKKKASKRQGKKSEVYAFEISDVKKLDNYFKENNLYLHRLAFVIGLNMARRVGDTLSLKWKHFFMPNGEFRKDLLEIVEEKTDKFASPHINKAVRDAIEWYVSETGCDVSENDYENGVFLQLSGTHKGAILSDNGYRTALKKAAGAIGITYNVGTHSTRKTFGKVSRMLHPDDYDSMEILQTIYNHADTSTTKHYIGLTKEKIDRYYDDVGSFFDDYIVGDKEFSTKEDTILVNLAMNDLRDIIKRSYELGAENAGNSTPSVHIDAVNSIMQMIDELKK